MQKRKLQVPNWFKVHFVDNNPYLKTFMKVVAIFFSNIEAILVDLLFAMYIEFICIQLESYEIEKK